MGKRGRSQKGGGNRNPKKRSKADDYVDPTDMDDEIDAFHRQRDVVPLDVNAGAVDSDEDDVEPVFGDEDIDDDDEDEDDDNDEDEEEDDEEENGLVAKITKQQKYLRAKFGGVDNEIEEEEPEEEKRLGWGGKKPRYHGGDNRDFELKSSDDEAPKEEEEEVLRLQRENAKLLSVEDFGLEDSDRELTLEEISVKGKERIKPPSNEAILDETGGNFEISKDLNALSREEQMDVVYSSAPELVGLLSELNAAVEELESKLNPLLSKVKVNGVKLEGGIRYLEMKQVLLLAYCQAITFYLLLKSEGHSVRDHPVIARLVEIKGLLDKTKDLDENLPSDLEELLRKNSDGETAEYLVRKEAVSKACELFDVSHNAEEQDQLQQVSKKHLANHKIFSNTGKNQQDKVNHDLVGVESKEMLRVRAALEAKLKSKGIFSASAPKPDKSQKNPKPMNGHLETYDDFDDDTVVVEKDHRGFINGSAASIKLSQLIPSRKNKPKVISGDDDLPKRDDIGERRRKHELRVLAGAGIKSEEDNGNELSPANESDEKGDEGMGIEDDGDESGSEEDFYAQVKQKREAKASAKAEMYKRDAPIPSLPETVDGKRHISRQIEKNRGLTRPRNKDNKNPRKKYRTKHGKAEKRRRGQVRDVKKPYGPYGGETSGINAGVSRSVRL